jgi:hypothetical protein
MLHAISSLQQLGDLILPAQLGHLAICTLFPLPRSRLSSTSATSHFAQLVLTAIPHLLHA